MPTTVSEKRSSAFPALVLGIILGLLAALLAMPAIVRHAGKSMRNRISMAFLGRHDTIDISQPTVIASIQRLARLESVVYTMDKVVEGDRTNQYLPDILTGDKLLLIVHGQAVAGVDLSKVQASNVQIDGRSVTISMPAAELLSVSLDNSKTRVYSRATGLLVPVDPNLESEVREKAEGDLRQSALDSGILTTAEGNARATLITMLHSLGFQQITFR
jgi:uncharacterized protein DUF4230